MEIDSKILPEVKTWQVGKKYKMEVEATLKELKVCEMDKTKIKAELEISKVKSSNERGYTKPVAVM